MIQQKIFGRPTRAGLEVGTARELEKRSDNVAESQRKQSRDQTAVALESFCNALVKQAASETAAELEKANKSNGELALFQARLDKLETIAESIRNVLSERLPKMSGLDDLHRQHAKLLDDFWSRQVESLFRGIVPVLDHIDGRLWALETKPIPSADSDTVVSEVSKFIRGIKVELLALLASHGIEPFHTGDATFSGKHHQAVKFIKANEASLNGVIARRLRPGYRSDDRVIRQELVEAYQFDDKHSDTSGGEACQTQ